MPEAAEPQPTVQRLSVSALRDYRRCPRYYKLKRIDKVPDPMTHHAPAGNLVHSSYYMAYGYPTIANLGKTGRSKLEWQVSGDFDPHSATRLFEALWWREAVTDPEDKAQVIAAEEQEYKTLESLPNNLHQAYLLLADDLQDVNNFVPGIKKSLKGRGQKELRAGWFEHFKEMLDNSLKHPLPHPVKSIERAVRFVLGGVDMLAYLDLVLDGELRHGLDEEIGIDLKTGYNKPSADELYFDDQIQTYRMATGVADYWLFHMKSGEIFSIDNNSKLIQSLDEMAEQDALAIASNYFPKRYDMKVCSRCVFRQHCHGT